IIITATGGNGRYRRRCKRGYIGKIILNHDRQPGISQDNEGFSSSEMNTIRSWIAEIICIRNWINRVECCIQYIILSCNNIRICDGTTWRTVGGGSGSSCYGPDDPLTNINTQFVKKELQVVPILGTGHSDRIGISFTLHPQDTSHT